MAKKPLSPDVEDDVEVSADADAAPAAAAPVQDFQVGDDVLRTYNLSEATWLAVNNPEAFARWQELTKPQAPKPNARGWTMPTERTEDAT